MSLDLEDRVNLEVEDRCDYGLWEAAGAGLGCLGSADYVRVKTPEFETTTHRWAICRGCYQVVIDTPSMRRSPYRWLGVVRFPVGSEGSIALECAFDTLARLGVR